MFSDSELKEIVEAKIKRDEDLGERAGGSGHLGFVSFELLGIQDPKTIVLKDVECCEITYTYVIIVETEFTYYPDNPPYEHKYQKTIVIDPSGNIVEETPKEEMSRSKG